MYQIKAVFLPAAGLPPIDAAIFLIRAKSRGEAADIAHEKASEIWESYALEIFPKPVAASQFPLRGAVN